MIKTYIADTNLITENPLGLATILSVCGRLTSKKDFAAIVYTTQVKLRNVCYANTWMLNQRAAEKTGFEIEYAEYTFFKQFRIGTREAREARLEAIADLKIHVPKSIILHSDRDIPVDMFAQPVQLRSGKFKTLRHVH